MSVTAQKPAAGVFGYEVADDISQNKNLLQQSVAALEANGVHVTLPGGGDFKDPALVSGDNRSGDPIAMERELIGNVMSALDGINAKASLTLESSAPADVVVLTSLQAGNFGNSITVKVESGSVSGKKITITSPLATTEVYDNVAATGSAFATALQGVSHIVSAVVASGGGSRVPVNISATPLAGGVGAVVSAPSFGGVASDDGASVRVTRWGSAIFQALQANGYIA
jgi:hypothetical protein